MVDRDDDWFKKSGRLLEDQQDPLRGWPNRLRSGRVGRHGGQAARTCHIHFSSIRAERRPGGHLAGAGRGGAAIDYLARVGDFAGRDDLELVVGDQPAAINAALAELERTARRLVGRVADRIAVTMVGELPADSTPATRAAAARALVEHWRGRRHLVIVSIHAVGESAGQPHLHLVATARPVRRADGGDWVVDRGPGSRPLSSKAAVRAEREKIASIINSICQPEVRFFAGRDAQMDRPAIVGRDPKRRVPARQFRRKSQSEIDPAARAAARARHLEARAANAARRAEREARRLAKAERVLTAPAAAPSRRGGSRGDRPVNDAQRAMLTDRHRRLGIELPDLSTKAGRKAAWENFKSGKAVEPRRPPSPAAEAGKVEQPAPPPAVPIVPIPPSAPARVEADRPSRKSAEAVAGLRRAIGGLAKGKLVDHDTGVGLRIKLADAGGGRVDLTVVAAAAVADLAVALLHERLGTAATIEQSGPDHQAVGRGVPAAGRQDIDIVYPQVPAPTALKAAERVLERLAEPEAIGPGQPADSVSDFSAQQRRDIEVGDSTVGRVYLAVDDRPGSIPVAAAAATVMSTRAAAPESPAKMEISAKTAPAQAEADRLRRLQSLRWPADQSARTGIVAGLVALDDGALVDLARRTAAASAAAHGRPAASAGELLVRQQTRDGLAKLNLFLAERGLTPVQEREFLPTRRPMRPGQAGPER